MASDLLTDVVPGIVKILQKEGYVVAAMALAQAWERERAPEPPETGEVVCGGGHHDERCAPWCQRGHPRAPAPPPETRKGNDR